MKIRCVEDARRNVEKVVADIVSGDVYHDPELLAAADRALIRLRRREAQEKAAGPGEEEPAAS